MFFVYLWCKKQTKHAMLSEDKVAEIYCMADDFCKFFNEWEGTAA